MLSWSRTVPEIQQNTNTGEKMQNGQKKQQVKQKAINASTLVYTY